MPRIVLRSEGNPIRPVTIVDNEMSVAEASRIAEEVRYRAVGSGALNWSEIEASPPCDAVHAEFEDNPFIDTDFNTINTNTSVDWSEEFMPSYANANDFPSCELPRWDIEERDTVVNSWMRQMDYRLRWIFYREEREGVSRTRYISPFNPDDFRTRIEKTSEPHPANTLTSTFYDWKIGGAEFLMRLERLIIKDQECLRCHFIHKSTGKEICYQDRVWDGQTYNEVNITWADSSPS